MLLRCHDLPLLYGIPQYTSWSFDDNPLYDDMVEKECGAVAEGYYKHEYYGLRYDYWRGDNHNWETIMYYSDETFD